ncbi:response regulator [Azospirillum brasilense]|nr:response regulator [Azospirillum brasilense]
MTIVLLEDDSLVRVAMSAFFRTEGIVVVAGATGAAMADLITLERLRPTLIVADFRLGSRTAMDEVPDILAVLPAAVPVIVTTGDTSAETRKLVEARGWSLLIKPYKPQHLLSVIKESRLSADRTC